MFLFCYIKKAKQWLIRKEHRKLSDLLTEIDHQRLEQIERIRNEYFKEMPIGHEFNKLNKNLLKKAFDQSKFVIIPLVALTIIIGFVTQLSFFTVAIICFVIYYGYNYNKIVNEYLQKDQSSPLTKEFFLEKLKEDGFEVTFDKMKCYRVFLDRYIHYKICDRHHDLSSRVRMHFDKRYANDLTPEELLESAILFKHNSDFLDHTDYID